MNEKLQMKLLSTFPFYDNSCDVYCGNGWVKVLEFMSSKIDMYARNQSIDNLKIYKIRQECGSLKVYSNTNDKVILSFIKEAEEVSNKVCEYCGKDGEVYNIQGWLITLCEDCICGPADSVLFCELNGKRT
jgi:hypothetical protein